MKKALKLLAILCCTTFLAACGKEETNSPDKENPDTEETVPAEPEKPEKPDPNVYPEGIEVSELLYNHSNGKTTKYYLATVDFKKNPDLKFTVIQNTPKAKPSKTYADFDKDYGIPYIVTNAGYFAGATSVSPLFINDFCSVIAPRSIEWPNYEKPEATVYPVRAAVGQMKDGSMDIAWVYCCDAASRTHYSFPSPLDNNEKTKQFMKEPPTKDTPGAKVWKPVWGVGGGPMLVKDGKDVAMDSYWKECLNSGGTAGSSHVPRTAVGLDKDGNLLIIVCDGRGMKGSYGLTLTELAGIFIKHGAVKAMNLDGGGSSAMIGKGGKLLNWPSDSGNGSSPIERRVVSCLCISWLPAEK